MRAGTLIRSRRGTLATVCHHGLDGFGAKIGDHRVAVEKAVAQGDSYNDLYPLPDVMLRGKWPTAPRHIKHFWKTYKVIEQ